MATGVRLGSAAGRWVVTATVLGSGMAMLDSSVSIIALPAIRDELDAGLAGLQWTVDGYLLPLAALILLSGYLADRFGPRPVYLLGTGWFALASLVCAVAPTTEVLVAGRALQGVGAALLTPVSLAILQTGLVPQDRARAIAAWSGLIGVATLVGPALGGWLITTASWRWIFLLNLPVAVAVVLVTLRRVPDIRPGAGSSRDPAPPGPAASALDPARPSAPGSAASSLDSTAPSPGSAVSARRPDIAGAVLGAMALGALTYGFIRWGEHGVDLRVVVAVLAGTAGLIGFGLLESRIPNPMLPPRLFANRRFAGANLVTLGLYGALNAALFLLIVRLQTEVGYSALAAGLATVPITLLMLAGSTLASRVATRIGPRWPLTVGPLVSGVGLGLLAGVGPDNGDYWTAVLPGMLVFGLGLTIVVAPLTATVLAAVDDDVAGVASGINVAVARTGGLLGVALVPLLAGGGLGDRFPTAMVISAAVAVASGLVGWFTLATR